MYGSKLTKIGRNSVPEFRPRKVNCGFSGVCSYLLDIICIMVSELMTVYTQCSAQVFKRAGCHLKRAF